MQRRFVLEAMRRDASAFLARLEASIQQLKATAAGLFVEPQALSPFKAMLFALPGIAATLGNFERALDGVLAKWDVSAMRIVGPILHEHVRILLCVDLH